MVVYNFKKIQAVPSSVDFVDLILSKTQRGTPTVVHPGYKISRIRSFYMRKVKYTQSNFHERLTQIITDFPRIEDIHPFYADLINILYDRDHYKLALGQINMARQLIDNVAKDYVKLLKYGDSLYRCKQLKKAALGRMCTVMKKMRASLAYLDQVRQHLARLPSIDPNIRTLLVCGYPNVGKSSFMNKVTRANVDVQPYAFTTKSLFVGHMDYKYLRWQVIDTPGILDKPLDERNTIEMQSITALAHLRAAILYVVDISEQCGYSLQQQFDLFKSIKPLFAHKPLLVAVNKVDARSPETLSLEERELLQQLEANGAMVQYMSTFTEEGITEVKSKACDVLLEQRVEQKLNAKKSSDIVGRLRVSEPRARDNKVRGTCIPDSILAAQSQHDETVAHRSTLKEMQEEEGGAGVFSFPLQNHWDLKESEWINDCIPEIMDGKNIADFVDPDILQRLDELEAEETELEKLAAMLPEDQMDSDEEEEQQLADQIREKKLSLVQQHRANKRTAQNVPKIPRTSRPAQSLQMFEQHLTSMGIDSDAVQNVRGRSKSRGRSLPRSGDKDGMEVEGDTPKKKKRDRSESRTSRSVSRTPSKLDSSMHSEKQKIKARKMAKKSQFQLNKHGKMGEADRHHHEKKPKHLFTGKRGNGKTDRR